MNFLGISIKYELCLILCIALWIRSGYHVRSLSIKIYTIYKIRYNTIHNEKIQGERKKMDEKEREEMINHLMYTKFIEEIAELKAAIIKNTGQLRELNHIMRVKKNEV